MGININFISQEKLLKINFYGEVNQDDFIKYFNYIKTEKLPEELFVLEDSTNTILKVERKLDKKYVFSDENAALEWLFK